MQPLSCLALNLSDIIGLVKAQVTSHLYTGVTPCSSQSCHEVAVERPH